jgi:hypothetical protein
MIEDPGARLDAAVEQIGQLPVLDRTVQRVLTLCRDADSSTSEADGRARERCGVRGEPAAIREFGLRLAARAGAHDPPSGHHGGTRRDRPAGERRRRRDDLRHRPLQARQRSRRARHRRPRPLGGRAHPLAPRLRRTPRGDELVLHVGVPDDDVVAVAERILQEVRDAFPSGTIEGWDAACPSASRSPPRTTRT